MNSQNQTSKFHTGHFPAGTIVVLNDEMYHYTTSKTPGEEFEITKIVRTGPSNYVLETTKKMDREAFGDMNQSFNMTHVKAIIKRGDGPVVFHERDFDPTDFRFLEEKHILANYLNIKIKKTHFAHWSLRGILMFCINNRPVNGSMLDMEAMVEAVAKQSFVKTNDRDGRGFGCVSVDKKRLKRFIKQNYNRFLVSVEKTQKEQDKMYDEINERDFDAAFDEREPLDQNKLFPNKQEGSSYDGSDYDYPSSLGGELDGLLMGDEEPRVEDEFLNEDEQKSVNAVGSFQPLDWSEPSGQFEVDLNKLTPEDKATFIKVFKQQILMENGIANISMDSSNLKINMSSLDEMMKVLDLEVQSGTVVETVRDEAYRLFKESGLSEQKLLTGQPALDKMMEGGIPAGELAVFSGGADGSITTVGKMVEAADLAKQMPNYHRFSNAAISVKHLEKAGEPLPAIPASEFEHPWPTSYVDPLLDQLMEHKADETEKKHEEDM